MTSELALALSLDPTLFANRSCRAPPGRRSAVLDRGRSLAERVQGTVAAAARCGARGIAWCDPEFPPLLLTLPDFPPALWIRGDLTAARAPSVALVGSRAASPEAIDLATTLGAELAARGATVVSGLARGVDSAAHRGALESGRTIVVLGSGPDHVYPPEHRGLADRIAAAGAVIGEYPRGWHRSHATSRNATASSAD